MEIQIWERKMYMWQIWVLDWHMTYEVCNKTIIKHTITYSHTRWYHLNIPQKIFVCCINYKMKRIEVNKIIVILLSFSFSLPFSIFIPNHVVLRYLTHFLYILNLFLIFAFVFSAAAVVFPVNNVRSRSMYVIHQRNFYFWNHMKMSKW